LGVPRRLQTIIEGESLVNDATALVIYRISISAAMTGAFSLTQGIFQFLWVGAGGVLVGMAVGALSIWFYNRLPDTKADILLSFLTAFLAYSLAERLHVSGVISTVAAGLYFGRVIPVSGSADVRVQAEATWDLMLFVINGLVFTLIGLQLPSVVHGLKDIPLSDLVFYTAILNILVFITRFLWVFPATYVPRWISRGLATRDPAPSWRVVTALGYTGMRGIVSLAAALSLPIVIPSGEVFPFRDLLIFLTYTVILTTLLLPSLTLPTLLRWLKIKATDEAYREEMTARLASATAVLRAYNDLSKNPRYLEHHLKQVEQRYRKHITTYQSNLTDQPFSELFDEDQKLRMLMKEIIQIERKALVDLRVKAAIHDEVFHMLSREIDLEEFRLKTHRI
jgi:CPA1 family monovalent cation:H+ antiporter